MLGEQRTGKIKALVEGLLEAGAVELGTIAGGRDRLEAYVRANVNGAARPEMSPEWDSLSSLVRPEVLLKAARAWLDRRPEAVRSKVLVFTDTVLTTVHLAAIQSSLAECGIPFEVVADK